MTHPYTLPSLLLIASALLGGCALPGKPDQAVNYYVLNDPGPVAHASAPLPGTLLLRDMDASVFYQDTRLTYSRAAATRGHYQFAFWSEPPARRLTWLLRQRLEAAGLFAAVAPLGAGVAGDYQLNTRLIDLYHDAAVEPGVALMLLDAEVVRRRDGRLLDHRVFVAQVPVARYEAEAAADAMGRAANQIIDEISDWLVQAVAAEGK